MKKRNPELDCKRWNDANAIGAAVNYRNDNGRIIETTSRSEAYVLGGHTAVIFLENVRGCVALDRVTVRL